MKLLEESGYPETKESIISLNPHLFSKKKYLVRIEPDAMLPKNEEFDRVMAERLYTLLRQDPLIDPEVLVRELAYTSNPQRAESMMAKQPPMGQPMPGQNPSAPPTLPSIPSNVMGGMRGR